MHGEGNVASTYDATLAAGFDADRDGRHKIPLFRPPSPEA